MRRDKEDIETSRRETRRRDKMRRDTCTVFCKYVELYWKGVHSLPLPPPPPPVGRVSFRGRVTDPRGVRW
jgi:hypothetical protein